MNAFNSSSALVAFHVAAFVVGLVLLFAIPVAGICVFAPLVLAQLGLINTWLAFGEGGWHERCALWAMAMFLLTMPLMCMPLPLAALHAAGLALMRWKLAGLYYYVGDAATVADRRLQFSVKQLMLVTFGVSLAFAAARAVKILDDRADLPFAVAAGFAVFGVAALMCSHAFALWAVLGTERPGIGVGAALSAAAALGGIVAFAINVPLPPRLVVPALLTVQQAIFAASLMVIRREGYRLFYHPAGEGPHAAIQSEIQFLDEARREI